MKFSEITKNIFLDNVDKYTTSKRSGKWLLNIDYKKYEYNFFYSVNLGPSDIKSNLYLYNNEIGCNEEQQLMICYHSIYEPLNISKENYLKPTFYKIGDITARVKERIPTIFDTEWYNDVKSWVYGTNPNLEMYPIFLRYMPNKNGFEIHDGNHRIIGKALRQGFTFRCNAFVFSQIKLDDR